MKKTLFWGLALLLASAMTIPALAVSSDVEAAYNAILEMSKTDANIVEVEISADGRLVLVVIAEGHEKEYAQILYPQFGSIVLITDSIEGANNAGAGGSGFDGVAVDGGNPWPSPWLWLLPSGCLLALASLFVLRNRRALAFAAADGSSIAAGSAPSSQAVVLAVKASEPAPGDGLFDSILQKLGR
jgi:hypothetical protein